MYSSVLCSFGSLFELKLVTPDLHTPSTSLWCSGASRAPFFVGVGAEPQVVDVGVEPLSVDSDARCSSSSRREPPAEPQRVDDADVDGDEGGILEKPVTLRVMDKQETQGDVGVCQRVIEETNQVVQRTTWVSIVPSDSGPTSHHLMGCATS